MRLTGFVAVSTSLTLVSAHLSAWSKGMYCLNGNTGAMDLNSYSIVTPLYQLSKNDWWFHHVNGCDNFPPADGDFLELPAGGQFTVEIASNRAKTTLSYSGKYSSDWPDGGNYPEDYNVPSCITSPNMHTQNQSMAAGTAFAISYQSDIKQVTEENLVVFSVRYHTPWKRIATYDVPSALPACPPGGCICAWGWIPNGCGQPNIYHQPFRCKVTGASSTAPVAQGKPPVWCEDDQSKCVKGAKQMIYWNQLDGNNIEVSGMDLSGHPRSPAYNSKCGFPDGAQNDIFVASPVNGNAAASGNNAPPSNSPAAVPASTSPAPPNSTPSTDVSSNPNSSESNNTPSPSPSASPQPSHPPTPSPAPASQPPSSSPEPESGNDADKGNGGKGPDANTSDNANSNANANANINPSPNHNPGQCRRKRARHASDAITASKRSGVPVKRSRRFHRRRATTVSVW